MTAVVPGTDWVADLDLDRQNIDLMGQSISVAQLARLAARFFSRAPSADGLDHILATGDQRGQERTAASTLGRRSTPLLTIYSQRRASLTGMGAAWSASGIDAAATSAT